MQIGPDDDFLCRTALVLTLYLPEPPTRAQGLDAWRVFASVCPPDRMKYIMDKKAAEYDELPASPKESDIEPYLREMDRRLDQGVVIWDGGEASCWGFNIEGVFEPDEPPQASFCQIIFPDEAPPRLMLDTARGLADCLPFLSGHGGLAALFSRPMKDEAFTQIYAWTKRYLGLEVEDLNRTLPVALEGAKGANWLTLVGNTFWDRLKQANKGAEPQPPPLIKVEDRGQGKLIIAGDLPVFADRNRAEFPDAYAAAERLILPIKVKSHPEFSGRFQED